MLDSVESFFFKLLLFVFFGLIAPGQFGRTKSLLLLLLLSLCLCVVAKLLLAMPTLFQSVIRRFVLPFVALFTLPIFPGAVNFKLPVNHCGGGSIRGLESLSCCIFCVLFSWAKIEFNVVLFNGFNVASIRFCGRSRSRSRLVITPPARTLNGI